MHVSSEPLLICTRVALCCVLLWHVSTNSTLTGSKFGTFLMYFFRLNFWSSTVLSESDKIAVVTRVVNWHPLIWFVYIVGRFDLSTDRLDSLVPELSALEVGLIEHVSWILSTPDLGTLPEPPTTTWALLKEFIPHFLCCCTVFPRRAPGPLRAPTLRSQLHFTDGETLVTQLKGLDGNDRSSECPIAEVVGDHESLCTCHN